MGPRSVLFRWLWRWTSISGISAGRRVILLNSFTLFSPQTTTSFLLLSTMMSFPSTSCLAIFWASGESFGSDFKLSVSRSRGLAWDRQKIRSQNKSASSLVMVCPMIFISVIISRE